MLSRESLRLDQGQQRTPANAPAHLFTLPSPSANGTPAPLPRPAPLPPALAKPFSVGGLVRALRRQWVLGLSAGVAAGVVAGCLAYALLPAARFSASASVHVAPRVPADSGSIAARARGRAVLDAVLDKPEIKGLSLLADRPDPREFLRNELTADWDAGPDVLSIRMSGSRPKELAALVSAVAEAAAQDINAGETREREGQVTRLEKIGRDNDESLGSRRKRLVELAGGDPNQRAVRLVLAATTLDARREELRKVQSDRRASEALLRAPATARPVADTPSKPGAKVGFEDMAKSDPDLKPLMAQLADLNDQVARFSALYKDNPAKAKQMIEERGLPARIDALQVQARQQYEKKLKAQGGPGNPRSPRPEPKGTEELKARVASCEAAEESLGQEIKKLEGDLDRMEAGSAEINAIRGEIALHDDVSKDAATALEKAQQELTAPARAALLDEATVTSAGDGHRGQLAALTGLGVFALTLFGVGFVELRHRKLHTIGDVAQGLGLPVAGTQAILPAALNPLDPAHAAAEGPVPWYAQPNDGADALRALVTQGTPAAARLLMVAGAVGGEGASVLAVQLAASLARAGGRTLLVDANLRRPALHRAFGLPSEPGLSEMLRGEAVPSAAVRAAPPDRVWLLPAGAADLRALQALARDGGLAVIDRLKKDYDYVVIDAAPVVACADGLPLAPCCDTVLLTVLAGVSGVPAVHTALQRLSLLGARLAGVVVQGAADDEAAIHRFPHR
jgi:Mrp family chromosome partitioning ATPase